MVSRLGTWLAFIGTALAAGPVAAGPDLSLVPPRAVLVGPHAAQEMRALESSDGGFVADRTSQARLVSSNPRVARVGPDGVVRAAGDGAAIITAVLGARRATATVRVRDFRKPFAWSFVNHVQSVLTRAGCNSGACHGASAGKGGLKLSLRGYDSHADFHALTRQALGRRVNPAEPTRSLLLQKASGGIPHGGGIRFRPGTPDYAVLAQWIGAGAPPPAAGDLRVERLAVFPSAASLAKGARQRLLVQAWFSDGRSEDVTRWVKFTGADDAVARVTDAGLVTAQGPGETAISIWCLNKVAFARVGSPHPRPVPAAVFARAERRNFIDELVLKKLQALRIPPAGPAGDEQFIRRAFLDAAGILPTPAEVAEFLADQAPNRRERLVDRLLARPEVTDYWAYKWSDLLLVSSRRLPAKGMWSFYDWIRESVAANKPWDQFVRELLTARGSTLRNGAANFYVLHKDPIGLTETTTQAFLGMSLTCARCHNHPLEKWTQDQYYAMANLFGRVRLKNGDTAGETLVFSADQGDVTHPRLGVPMPPQPLDGTALPLEGPEDRREALAAWLTDKRNPFFARAIVNRVWRNFMGRGLVEAEDDLRLTNPPSNEELFAAVTRDFADHGFDLRRLMRAIMTSATYQRSSQPPAGGVADAKYYSAYIPRRLSAEVLLDAISQVTGVPTDFPGYPRGTRALQLPDSQVASYFLTAFGRPERAQTCACERQEEPSVAQALHLSNGETINSKLRAAGGTAERLAKEALAEETLVERLYQLVYARRPNVAERARVLTALKQYPAGPEARREVVEDLLSAMLTTKEFLFNH
jgi:hypothetical protein